MPRLIETESRTGTVVAAINDLLARDGVSGLSIRAIARQSRVSASSLLHHYESREHLLRIAAVRSGRSRVAEIDRNAWRHGPLAFLPRHAEDVVDARAWLAWLELWRSEDSLTEVIWNARLDERALLAEMVDHRLERDRLDAVLALIDGLLTAVCSPHRPMSLDRARAILKAAITTSSDGATQPTDRDDSEAAVAVVRNRSRRWRERATS